MSDSIKRSTWERLDYIESVDFMLIPKGHELFFTLKPDAGDEIELGDIEGDLADFFFYHIGQSYPHEFAFPGQLIQDQEDKLYATYYYYVEPEIDLSEDTKGKFLITALPLIEKLYSNGNLSIILSPLKLSIHASLGILLTITSI